MSRRASQGGDSPLFAWGEDLRHRKQERRRLLRRTALIAGLLGAVMVSVASPPVPRFVWNASASAPIGLYHVSTGRDARRGDMVIVHMPLAFRRVAAERHYIPVNVPLVKHVGAVSGDTVCAIGKVISIDGNAVATRSVADGMGRPMPWWTGCRLLHQGDIFLLSADQPASFDGRYFGVSPSADVVGIARPIWTR